MKALVVNETALEFSIQERPMPDIKPGEVLIRMKAAALNHRDLNVPGYLARMKDSNPEFPISTYVVGADGAGVIEEIGENVTGWKIGDEVMISSLHFCGHCPACVAGMNVICEQANILGSVGQDGTIAAYLSVPAKLLIHKPQHLDFTAAAALPMALGTAWRAVMTQGQLQAGETVLVQGIGGGVALFSLQIAVALGAKVIVTSSSDDKLAKAAELGAYAGINYKQENVLERIKEVTQGKGVDLAVDGGGAATLPIAVQSLRDMGRVVNYGFMTGRNLSIDIYHFMIRQVSLIGSAMHTFGELEAAVRFFSNLQLQPVISDVYEFQDVLQAIDKLHNGSQFGKIVIDMK